MISAVLTFALLLALMVVAAVMLPSIVQPTVPFGVRVPPERVDAPVIGVERRRYRRWVVVLCGGAALLALAIAVVTGRPAVLPAALLVVLGLWLVAYARAHVAIAGAKEREGWYSGLRQGVAVDTSLRTAPERFPWWWALPALLILAATVGIGIVRYPHLPAVVAIHYGLNGRPNAFAQRSVAGAFGLVLVQAGITALIIGAAWAWMGARAQLEPRRARAGARQHRIWVARMSRASLGLAACANLSLLLISLTQWQILRPAGPTLLLSLLPIVAGTAALLAVSVRTPQEAPPTPGMAAGIGGALVQRDDDRLWIGGLFYWNPDDPAMFVPKRFGVGLTLNLSNVRSWLLLAALLAVAVGSVVAAILAAGPRHHG